MGGCGFGDVSVSTLILKGKKMIDLLRSTQAMMQNGIPPRTGGEINTVIESLERGGTDYDDYARYLDNQAIMDNHAIAGKQFFVTPNRGERCYDE
jgi:hypothetical protein